jgi:hypothetical protein
MTTVAAVRREGIKGNVGGGLIGRDGGACGRGEIRRGGVPERSAWRV